MHSKFDIVNTKQNMANIKKYDTVKLPTYCHEFIIQ